MTHHDILKNARFAVYGILGLEALWALGWAISMIMSHAILPWGPDDAMAKETRLEITLMIFHLGSVYGTLSLLEHVWYGRRIVSAPLFWVFITLFTDINSVLRAFLHLPLEPNIAIPIDYSWVSFVQAYSVVATGITLCAMITSAYLYATQNERLAKIAKHQQKRVHY